MNLSCVGQRLCIKKAEEELTYLFITTNQTKKKNREKKREYQCSAMCVCGFFFLHFIYKNRHRCPFQVIPGESQT